MMTSSELMIVCLLRCGNVREGDVVVAHGLVRSVDENTATCEIWLELPSGRRAVDGTAVIEI